MMMDMYKTRAMRTAAHAITSVAAASVLAGCAGPWASSKAPVNEDPKTISIDTFGLTTIVQGLPNTTQVEARSWTYTVGTEASPSFAQASGNAPAAAAPAAAASAAKPTIVTLGGDFDKVATSRGYVIVPKAGYQASVKTRSSMALDKGALDGFGILISPIGILGGGIGAYNLGRAAMQGKLGTRVSNTNSNNSVGGNAVIGDGVHDVMHDFNHDYNNNNCHDAWAGSITGCMTGTSAAPTASMASIMSTRPTVQSVVRLPAPATK